MVRVPLSLKTSVLQGLGLFRVYRDFAGFVLPFSREAARFTERVREAAPRFVPGIERIFRSGFYLQTVLSQYPQLQCHPNWPQLFEIVTGKTSLSPAGHPYLNKETFELFVNEVPHLFQDGLQVLDWLDELEHLLSDHSDLLPEGRESIDRAAKAMKTMIFTASVTAPCDLWVLRQILSRHKKIGTLDDLNRGRVLNIEKYAKEQGLDPKQLSHDIRLLYARRYLDRTELGFVKTKTAAGSILEDVQEIPDRFQIDMFEELCAWFRGESDEKRENLIRDWFHFRHSLVTPVPGWVADLRQIDIGYHLLPLILALDVSGKPDRMMPEMKRLLEEAGLVRDNQGTLLGARVMRKGSGAMGIIGAYHRYLTEGNHRWVKRAQNISASQQANRESFEKAVENLDRFCRETGFTPTVIIEHALGLGVAIKEFCKRFDPARFHFIGADFEPAALERAQREQEAGRLPAQMKFFEADIGKPRPLIRFIKEELKLPTEGAVMIVGNGFHEVRDLDDDGMVEIFRILQEAGIILIMAEELALTDEQLRETAWNTYHTGFRWAHDTSGQRLRPYLRWRKCLERAGYKILSRFTRETRTIFPYPLPKDQNSPVSVTFFCVPRNLPFKNLLE